MSDQTVEQADLAKALTALQDLAKGHSSRGTNTTDVPSMQDAGKGAGSGAGSTQVFHTPANSEPAEWAGSRKQPEGEDGAHDSISENGTDYQAQGKVMKSIMDKLAKGHALTPAEFALVKAMSDKEEEDVEKAAKPFAGEETDEEEKMEQEVSKSLSDFANEDSQVSKGLEVSEFLAGFASVIEKSLQTLEERVVTRLSAQANNAGSETAEFQKSLAGALAGLGETIAAVVQRVDQVEGQAAHAPRSVQGVQPISKGFEGPAANEPLNKALVGNALVQLVQDNKAAVTDVIKFESTGEISPQLETTVRGMLGSGR